MLLVLRENKAIPPSQSAKIPVEVELVDFHHYMDHVCGLAVNTLNQRTGIVRKSLSQHYGSRQIAVTQVTAADVRRFALEGLHKRTAGTIGVIAGTLRCYFRFRAVAGDNIGHILVALPSVANWRLAAVPEVFTDVDIQQLLDSFIQLNCSPRRGHAMMRCPTDLGLKASEVIRPKLKDLDWHVGTIP